MGEIINITLPLKKEELKRLKTGDMVLLSGVIYTARDQAHLRLVNIINENKPLPVELDGQVIYYCGPTPSGKNVIGSCGPTTSSRMDRFTGAVLSMGVSGLIGKGSRSSDVRKKIAEAGSVYFAAPAGAGAFLSRKVVDSEIVAFEDLGPEAIYRLTVKDFPVIVAIDSRGNSLYRDLEEADQCTKKGDTR